MTGKGLEQLVEEAKAGSRQALEQVLENIQENVYGLSLRMLWHPEDARDASQEILIRVMTHLGDFRGDSAFRTWVYRVSGKLSSRCPEESPGSPRVLVREVQPRAGRKSRVP